ncbi:MAG: flagellin [Sulfuricurvum sp.]|nr:flagellin [Sulfuricurvum sp.]
MSISSLTSTTTPNFLYDANKTKQNINNSLSEISSGKVANLDPASQAIANLLQSQAGVDMQGIQNGSDAIGMLQIADATLTSLQQGADQLNQLSVQMGNGALNSDQQSMLQQQAQTIKQSMQQDVNSATYNGQSVFGSFGFNLGTSMVMGGTTAPNPSSLDITNQQSITDFMKNISTAKSDIGSQINGIGSSMMNNINQVTSLTSASSQISDADFAQSIMDLQQNSLKLKTQLYAQAHNTDAMKASMGKLLG